MTGIKKTNQALGLTLKLYKYFDDKLRGYKNLDGIISEYIKTKEMKHPTLKKYIIQTGI